MKFKKLLTYCNQCFPCLNERYQKFENVASIDRTRDVQRTIGNLTRVKALSANLCRANRNSHYSAYTSLTFVVLTGIVIIVRSLR